MVVINNCCYQISLMSLFFVDRSLILYCTRSWFGFSNVIEVSLVLYDTVLFRLDILGLWSDHIIHVFPQQPQELEGLRLVV